VCIDFLSSSDILSLAYAACNDIRMYLVRIILICKDFYVIIPSSYVTGFGRYPNVSSMLKYYCLLFWCLCIKSDVIFYVRVFPSSGTFKGGTIDPRTSIIRDILCNVLA
jgi:hypothetical protein